MDMKILDWIQRMSTPWLDKFMIAVTTLGKGNAVWLASAIILFLIPKTRRLGAAGCESCAGDFVLQCDIETADRESKTMRCKYGGAASDKPSCRFFISVRPCRGGVCSSVRSVL